MNVSCENIPLNPLGTTKKGQPKGSAAPSGARTNVRGFGAEPQLINLGPLGTTKKGQPKG